MGSSTSPNTREPWIPDLPDNEAAVWDTLRHYQEGLTHLTIPELMTQATRIAAEQQALAGTAMSSTLSSSLEERIRGLDQITLRSPSTVNPDWARGRNASLLPQRSLQPDQAVPRSRYGGGSGLGPRVAQRIAMAQVRKIVRDAQD